MDKLLLSFKRLRNRRFFTFGLPFMVFMVGGSFGLKEFTSLRYEYRETIPIVAMAKEEGISAKEPGEVTLETEFEKIQKLDIENWKNVRGPRPWEKDDNKT